MSGPDDTTTERPYPPSPPLSVVVASELDPSTERIINYPSDSHGVPINAVFFRCFRDAGKEHLTRTWLIDPLGAESEKSKSRGQKGAEA